MLYVDRSSSSSHVLSGPTGRSGPPSRALNSRGRNGGPDDAVVAGTTRTDSSAVSQALTQPMQQTGRNPPLATAANYVTQNTAAVQQVQSPSKFDIPAFDGDSAAAGWRGVKRVVYQAKACGFEAELTAAEGEELSVGADVFEGSNVDPVRLRNAHVAWMMSINNCKV